MQNKVYSKIVNEKINDIINNVMEKYPEVKEEDILKMLKEYKVSIIELGVQSLDEDVLRDSIRGHHAEEVLENTFTSMQSLKCLLLFIRKETVFII